MVCLEFADVAEELGLGGHKSRPARNPPERIRRTGRRVSRTPGQMATNVGFEADFTRYSVIFTGEKLPDGRRADAVYIILNEPYREVPVKAPQRLLELRIFESTDACRPAVLRSTELSDICRPEQKRGCRSPDLIFGLLYVFGSTALFRLHPPQKQMWKIHRPHLLSGYLKESRYTATTDAEGNPDWMMHLFLTESTCRIPRVLGT